MNGQLASEVPYKDGKEEGLSRSWYENGSLWNETNWKDGKEEWLMRSWYANGQLKMARCYSNDKEVDMSNCQVATSSRY